MNLILILSTRRAPAGIAVQRFEASGDRVTIGRGSNCDWVLPDPERLLSKRHCELVRRAGRWTLIDLSSNGLTLNGRLITPGVASPLQEHDRLDLGAYEIDVTTESNTVHPDQEPRGRGVDRLDDDFGRDPFADDTARNRAPAARLLGDPFSNSGADSITDPFDIALPPSFGGGERDEPLDVPRVVGDAASALSAPFQLPRTAGAMLPPDWDAPEALPCTAPQLSDTPPIELQQASNVQPALLISDPIELAAPVTTLKAGQQPSMPHAGTLPAERPDSSPGSSAAAFATFARGAGLDGAPLLAPDVALEHLGRAFRAFVIGLRRAMMARATIKGEFRIDRTMIQPFGNNPLKFAADDDDALAALLGIRRQVAMTPEQSVAEAMRDLRFHELAVTRAIESALAELVASLGPGALLDNLPDGLLDSLPGRRKSRAWDAYVAAHDRVRLALGDSFDSVFGRAFGRAYEIALGEMAAAEEAGQPVPAIKGSAR